MTQKDYIVEKLEQGMSKKEIRALYDDFVYETGASCSPETFSRRIRQEYADLYGSDDEIVEDSSGAHISVKMQREEDGNSLNIVTTSEDIKTLDQLLEYAKVDLEKYYVKRHIINSWTTYSTKLGSKIPLENYQVKAWLEVKQPEPLSHEDKLQIIKDKIAEFEVKNVYVPKVKTLQDGTTYMASFYPTDHHLGLLAFNDETRDYDWNLEKAKKVFMDSVYGLYEDVRDYNIEKFVFVIGGDALNVDGPGNSTTKGTPQDQASLYKKCFEFGLEIYIEAVEFLAEHFPVVDCLHIPGNHDNLSSYYLAVALDQRFKGIENVFVDLQNVTRKYVEYGNTLIAYNHGDTEFRAKGALPLILSYEMREHLADKKFVEIHSGHVHAEKEISYESLSEDVSIKTRVIPCLSPRSKWAETKGYASIMESQLYLYTKDRGNKAIFKFVPDVI